MIDVKLQARLQNTNPEETKVGHIFGEDGYSLCWGESAWSLKLDAWFWPGVTHPESVGLDDGGKICWSCAERVRKHLKPKVKT